jgi:hypothetical protein
MEDEVIASGNEVAKTPLEELDRIWNQVKKAEPLLPKK